MNDVSTPVKEYQTLQLSIENKIAHVQFNRPQKANALNKLAWEELKDCFEQLDETPEARVIVLSGNGKHFCSGIDISLLMGMRQQVDDKCEGRMREKLRKMVFHLQAPINAIEKCSKPVLAAIHGGCIGGGVDIVTACDMRYATQDAYFTVKEIDMGMVADLGTLQRLPKLIGEGIAREMAYTGRKVASAEAKDVQLVNSVYADKEEMMAKVMELAQLIAAKSPLSIRGSKAVLNYTRDHSVEDGLNFIATWNAAMIMSDDLATALQASMMKQTPEFKD
ncbi:MAG: crotonase/enoyl-CoA hydratase family protein [Flammeovirgaceae bacterium]